MNEVLSYDVGYKEGWFDGFNGKNPNDFRPLFWDTADTREYDAGYLAGLRNGFAYQSVD